MQIFKSHALGLINFFDGIIVVANPKNESAGVGIERDIPFVDQTAISQPAKFLPRRPKFEMNGHAHALEI